MVWTSRLRRRQRKHAFEQALDDVRLDPDGAPPTFEETDGFNPGAARSVASFGDITVAPGYVARASLQRAYGDEGDDEPRRPAMRPAEAALGLKTELEARALTSKELNRLRRQFAAGHHPDRVPQDQRDEAVQAMAEVNAAIDRALKRVQRP